MESFQLRNILLPCNYRRSKINFFPGESRLFFYKTLPRHNGQRHWVLRLLGHLKFKAEAPTSFEILIKL